MRARLRIPRSPVAAVLAVLLAGCGGGGGGGGGGGDDGVPASASVARGARLYDTWWPEVGAAAPLATHPAYPTGGAQTGATTWRCAECHGWDYRGATGQFSTGPHATGFAGILAAATDAPAALFAAIEGAGTSHDFAAALATDDVWDLVAFVRSGAADPAPWIDAGTGASLGSATAGASLYATHCASCHGADGGTLDLGDGDGVGERADAEPWRALHRIRWGNPGTAMPSFEALGLSRLAQADVLAYAQTLSTSPGTPPPPPPATLSYAGDIVPIFTARSCTGCHGTSGDLTLSGTAAASYAELFEQVGRVNTTTPSASLLLRKPSQSGVSHGGGKLFGSTADADYQKLLLWITQGALFN